MAATEQLTFGEVCRTLRTVLGFAQEDLAAHLDVSRKTVQRWERGMALPDDRVESLLAVLCRDRRVFERLPLEHLTELAGWDDVATVLWRSRTRRLGRPAAPDDAGEGLIGRDDDITAVRSLLSERRLVTITGPGGVGKTSLARAIVAGQSGAVLVELAQATSVDVVLDVIAEQLGTPIAPNASVRAAVIGGLAGIELLVLDNLEHLPRAAPLVTDLVDSCPQLRVLATSRTPIRVRDEHIYGLAPLSTGGDVSAAATLFTVRARAAGAVVEPTDAQVEVLCRRLDGLPLAIELTAHRLRAFSLDELVDRLDDPLRVVGGGGGDRPDRHRSMRACLAWSLGLLAPSSRRLLGRLAPFVGGATLTTAEFVGEASVLDDLAALVDASLVTRTDTRYRMTEAVRSYCIAEEHDEHEALVKWATACTARIAAASRGPNAEVALREFDDELTNLRAALVRCLDHGQIETAQTLCLSLTAGWDARSMLREARHWIERSLDDSDTFRHAALSNWYGYFTALQGEYDIAARHTLRALAVWEHHRIDAGIGYACLILARCAAEADDLERAGELLGRSVTALNAAGDEWGLIRSINALGELARETGDLDEARRRHLDALERCRQLGDQGSQVSILADLANVAADRADADEAVAWAEQALALATRHANTVGVANALDALGRAQLLLGRAAAAIDSWTESDSIRVEIGHPVERRDRRALERDRAIATGQLNR